MRTEIIAAARRVRLPHVLIVVGLALYWLSLAFFPRVWNRWPLRSHYHYQNARLLWPLGLTALPLLLCVVALLLLTSRRRKVTPAALLLLFVGAVSLQWSFSFLGELTARRLSATLVATRYGHSEFLKIAAQEEQPLVLARHYEDRCAQVDPRSYTQTKPPGQLLFYVLAVRLYRLLGVEGPCERLADWAGFEHRGPLTAPGAFVTAVFSLVSCLPVIVMAWLGARLEGSDKGLYYGLAFLLCPATLLITMHLDQVLYPLCVSCALLAAALALQRHAGFGALTGLLLYVSLYVSFSLLFLLPTVALWWATHALVPEQRRRLFWAVASCTLALLTAYAVFRWGLGFELVRACRRAAEHHAAWRGAAGLVGPKGTLRNLVEAAFWLGIPAAVLCGTHWLRCARDVFNRRIEPLSLFLLLYPLIVIAISTFGATTREIGRLWIPMLIPAQTAAAREMNRLYPRRPTGYVLLASLAVLLRKNYHDFC
jgi:hypothetical protein